MVEVEIPSDSTAIIDSSVLFAMGGPSNEKYQAFERFVRQRNLIVTVPEQVAAELCESPDAYAYQRDQLRAAQDAGWLEPGQIDFSTPRVPEVVDKTRRRMLSLSADDDTEKKGVVGFMARAKKQVKTTTEKLESEDALQSLGHAAESFAANTIFEGKLFDVANALSDYRLSNVTDTTWGYCTIGCRFSRMMN